MAVMAEMRAEAARRSAHGGRRSGGSAASSILTVMALRWVRLRGCDAP